MRTKALGGAALAAMAAGLGGCAGDGWLGNRYGPDPVMLAQDAREVSERQTLVLSYFHQAAHEGLYPVESTRWFYTTEIGMNYVDEKCDAYLRDLFRIDRRRDRVRGGLVLLDKTSGAILGAADASAKSIQILAQSFGFSIGLTDIVADSYLFKVAPGIVFSNVDKAQQAYRLQTEKDAAKIRTPGAAYQRIRGYLALCFPQSIEARMEEYLAKAGASTKEGGGDAGRTAGFAATTTAPATSVAPRVTLVPPQ